MTIPFSQTQQSKDPASTGNIKPLPLMTLLSMANRLLRFSFPPQRERDAYCRILQKAGCRDDLELLTEQDLATAVRDVFHKSVFVLMPQAKIDASLDTRLAALATIIDLMHFQPERLVETALKQLAAQSMGQSLHGYFFQFPPSAQQLTALLDSQGVEPLSESEFPLDRFGTYWLATRLKTVMPWQAILSLLPASEESRFPYLAFLGRCASVLKTMSSTELFNPVICNQILEQVPWEPLGFRQPYEVLVLVEGATEVILLPAVAAVMGYDFAAAGIRIQPVGGKNQMLAQFAACTETLRIPVCAILDLDAADLAPQMAPYQRSLDSVYVLPHGEVEDHYPDELILAALDRWYQPNCTLEPALLAFEPSRSRTKSLEILWPQLGLGSFNKVDFARKIAATLPEYPLIADAFKDVIKALIAVRTEAHDTLSIWS